MAISLQTKKMLRAFQQLGQVPRPFFSGMFQAPRENFFDSKTVVIDIERSDEDVAVAIQDMATGGNYNSFDKFDTKEFEPPVFKEDFSINAYDTMDRTPGTDPFTEPHYLRSAVDQFRFKARLVRDKILRSIEWQAAQVMQTGEISLTDSGGNVRYAIDYKPKATHFPTVTTAWATTATATPIDDLESLATVIRKDGLGDVGVAVFGTDAWENAWKVTSFQKRFDLRNADFGRIVPPTEMGDGGQYRGRLEVGNYSLDVYTYNGYYKSPAGTVTPLLGVDNVVMWIPGIRLDAVFGNIPRLFPPEQRLSQFIPPRMQVRGRGGFELITNVWRDPDGESVYGRIGARPLMIPTQIDGYGCLNTGT